MEERRQCLTQRLPQGASWKHHAPFGGTELKPKVLLEGRCGQPPLPLSHLGLESCSHAAAKPWSHPRSWGSPESAEVVVGCPVLS